MTFRSERFRSNDMNGIISEDVGTWKKEKIRVKVKKNIDPRAKRFQIQPPLPRQTLNLEPRSTFSFRSLNYFPSLWFVSLIASLLTARFVSGLIYVK